MHKIKRYVAEIDGEQRRHSEANKSVNRADRRLRELQFQVDENKKTHDRLTDLVEKLQQKLKTTKRQVEEAVCFYSSVFENSHSQTHRKSSRLAISRNIALFKQLWMTLRNALTLLRTA